MNNILSLKAVLFDLDGTIINPKQGIINSILFAVEKTGLQEQKPEELNSFIGPPLHQSFQKRYGVSESEAFEMVRQFRVYYAEKGIRECYVYDGIEELVKKLHSHQIFLSLATSKPIGFANQLLEYFKLDKYFSFTAGALMDGKRTDKKEVIQFALDHIPTFEKQEILMIGDREFDIEGGQFHGLKTAWAQWGFGSDEEILPLSPDFVFSKP
ncbi:MAG: HAD hydrolase-like protein, partial [Bacteroidales bacterium]|nr:HAD hydrolase-like protein [Bacteroidales bacterium]